MRLERLAPIAFVAGIVLFGLSILALTFTATAPGHGPVEDHETTVVGDEAVVAFPVPVSPHMALQVDVTFEYPRHPGKAMIMGCSGYSALLHGQEPQDIGSSSFGDRGRLTSTTSPAGLGDDASQAQCPFRYAVFQWDLRGEGPEANRPDVSVLTSPVIMPGVVVGLAAGVALLGLVLAFWGGTAWARRLQRVRGTEDAGDAESTSETLLLLIGKTGDWLTRTRRYLIAAGILGIFLWYPIVLPWAWSTALRGSSGSLYPWLLALGAFVLLLALTVVWARAYLRLDRELVSWRARMDRLHAREARLLADLDASG